MTHPASAELGVLPDRPILPLDRSPELELRKAIDAKCKPIGSLGRLEDLAVQLGLIWHPQPPRAHNATLFVFAADHGLATEGVSRYPADVTRAMVGVSTKFRDRSPELSSAPAGFISIHRCAQPACPGPPSS